MSCWHSSDLAVIRIMNVAAAADSAAVWRLPKRAVDMRGRDSFWKTSPRLFFSRCKRQAEETPDIDGWPRSAGRQEPVGGSTLQVAASILSLGWIG